METKQKVWVVYVDDYDRHYDVIFGVYDSENAAFMAINSVEDAFLRRTLCYTEEEVQNGHS